MVRVVLIRHGESEWNVERRIQGQGGSGLSDRGHAQAETTAAMLAETYPDGLLVSSDLQRCVETATYLAAAFGRDPIHEAGLRERDFGSWTGLLATEIAEQHPETWRRFRSGDEVIADLGGEDSATLVERTVATLRTLIQRVNGERALVCVTHGGPIWYGTHALLGVDPPVLGAVANCAITELDLDERDVWLASYNQVAHLPPELRISVHGRRRRDRLGDEEREAEPQR